MIDTLIRLLPKAEARWPALRSRFSLSRFVLVTLHRPANVDGAEALTEIMTALGEIGRDTPVLFPVHPRTRQRMTALGLSLTTSQVQLTEPLGYLDFLALQRSAALVLTDSGGVQEETTYLGIPCLTIRPNTERPVTITCGTNRLVASRRAELVDAAQQCLHRSRCLALPAGSRPELWDGHAAERIVAVFHDLK